MPSTYSTNLRLELIASGEQANTWGNTTNTNLGTLVESAISGYVALNTMSDADYTLIALNGANDQARQMYINVPSGVSLSATRSIIAPSVPKVYVISNTSSGGQAVRIKTSGSTTTCLIPNGQTKTVVCDGTNFSEAVTAIDTLTLGANPTSALQATTKQYVDAADALKLNLTGGTMTGALNLIASAPTGNNATSFNYVNTNYIQKTGSGTQTVDQFLSLNYTPSLAAHAVNVSYVSTQLANYVPKSGTTMTGALTLLSADPSGTWQATPKSWVDTQISNAITTAENYAITYYVPKTRTISAGTTNVSINGIAGGSADLSGNITIAVAASATGVTAIAGTTPILINGASGVPASGNVTVSISPTAFYPYSSATYVPTNGTGATGTWGISISQNAATATAPASGGTFITSSNIATQTVASAGACSGNAATATSVAWSGITSIPGNFPGGCTGTATNASSLGGVAASLYATDAEVAASYLPLSAGSSKPLTGLLFGQNPSFATSKTIMGVWAYEGNYYPFMGSHKTDTGANYAAFAIGQFNNSTLSGSDPQVPILITTAGEVNFNYLCSFAAGIDVYGGTKNFFIQHPIIEDKSLIHSAVEAPRADLIYRGTVTLNAGQGSVTIDAESRMTEGTFASLTQNAEVVALHNKTGFTRIKSTEIVDGVFTILAEDTGCSDTISWVVMAERNDAAMHTANYCDSEGRLVPEQDKQER